MVLWNKLVLVLHTQYHLHHLFNFPPPDGIGNTDLYDTFDDIPNFARRASAYVEGVPERVVEEWIIADRDFLDNFATQPGDLYYGIDIPAIQSIFKWSNSRKSYSTEWCI